MDKKRWRLRRAMLLSVGLLWTCLGFSQTQNPHTLLWKVSGNGLKKPSYVFGTMHILCADDAHLSDSLRLVISKVDEIFFEIDLSDMTGMLGAMKYMRMNDGTKLSDLLTADEYARVKAYFNQHASSLPFGMLERFKPMLVSSLIETAGLDCKVTDGMEMTIMKEVRNDNKTVNGLETVEFQAGLFDSIPYSQQAKELVNYVDSSDEYKKMTKQLADVYREQDLDKIDSLTRQGDPAMNSHMDLLLYNRNRAWAKTLATIFPNKSLLVAVGAAHLPGKDGVLNLLRRQGYKVTPVNNN